MRPVSNNLKNHIMENFLPMTAELVVVIDPDNLDYITITGSRIVANSLKINYASAVGNEPRFGTVIAPELTFTLINDDGAYDNVNFLGKEVRAYCNAEYNQTPESFAMGRFIVDDAKLEGKNIRVTALGIITKMDKVYRSGDISFPITAWNLAAALITECGLTLKAYAEDDYVWNRGIVIPTEPEDNKYTYRQLLGYVCEIMACSAQTRVIGGTEKVVLRWYGAAAFQLSDKNVFTITYDKSPVMITKAEVIAKNGTGTSGSGENVYTVKDNPLTDDMQQATLDSIAAWIELNAEVMVPAEMSASVLPVPFLEPLDAVPLKDKNNQTICFLYISNYTWQLNKNTEFYGVGYKQPKEENYSPFTGNQDAIIGGMKEMESGNADAISVLQSLIQPLLTDYVIENGSADGWEWRIWSSGKIELRASDMEVTPILGGDWGTVFKYFYFDVPLPVTLADTDYSVFCTRSSGSTFMVIGCAHSSTGQFRVAVALPPPGTTPNAFYADLMVVGTVDISTAEPLADEAEADVAILTE